MASAPAFSQNLGLTVDLMAPATPCTGSKCPSDISLPNLGSAIAADSASMDGSGATVTLNTATASPIVCSEQSGSLFGPQGGYRFSPVYSNAAPNGGLFEFDAGGASVVDATQVSMGSVLAMSQANTSNTQVACYSINALGVNNPILADSSVIGDRVFYAEFEGGHRANEPWVSVNTVNAVSTSDAVLGYVVQIHNASFAANWHLSFGYDHSFSQSVNSGFSGHYYVLGPSITQPGLIPTQTVLNGTTNADFTTTYVVSAGDIHSDSNSVFIYVLNHSSAALAAAWSTLPTSFYSASAAVFSPPGTYVQRVDDKVAVAGNVNLPTQNIGNIVCANDPLATACTITDSDGAGIPASITFKNQFAAGAVAVDPVAYVVDTGAGTTLPGTIALAAPTNVSCNDPNGILLGSVSFGTSTGAAGARALGVAFTPVGPLFQPGTATCTATFTANGFSSTQSFNITMQQINVTHFDVTADNTATAGDTVNFTVTAKDGAGNTVPTYAGTVGFTSSDPLAVLPGNAALTLGVGNFTATLKKAGAQTITGTDTSSSTIKGTSNPVAVSAASAASFVVQMLGTAEQNQQAQLNLIPYDQYNNHVTSGYSGTVHFTSTDTAAVLPTDAAFTNGIYNVTFKTLSPPDWTVTATDTTPPSITGTSSGVTVIGD